MEVKVCIYNELISWETIASEINAPLDLEGKKNDFAKYVASHLMIFLNKCLGIEDIQQQLIQLDFASGIDESVYKLKFNNYHDFGQNCEYVIVKTQPPNRIAILFMNGEKEITRRTYCIAAENGFGDYTKTFGAQIFRIVHDTSFWIHLQVDLDWGGDFTRIVWGTNFEGSWLNIMKDDISAEEILGIPNRIRGKFKLEKQYYSNLSLRIHPDKLLTNFPFLHWGGREADRFKTLCGQMFAHIQLTWNSLVANNDIVRRPQKRQKEDVTFDWETFILVICGGTITDFDIKKDKCIILALQQMVP